MKSMLFSTCMAAVVSLAVARDAPAEIVVHISGQSHGHHGVRHGYSHDRGLSNRAYYGRGYQDFHPYRYAQRAADCYPYARPHYFYEWQRPYYGFRANSGGYPYGYGY